MQEQKDSVLIGVTWTSLKKAGIESRRRASGWLYPSPRVDGSTKKGEVVKSMGRERHSKPPSSTMGGKKHNEGPASFKLRACMGGKKSPQIHHHDSGDKEPLERKRKLKDSGKLPTYPSPKTIFLKLTS